MHITITEGISIVFALSVLIDISPIHIDPWKAIARWIGKAINSETLTEIREVKSTLTNHIEEDEEERITSCRRRLLRFNDEVLEKKRHSREHFRDAMRDIDRYERYCEGHPEFKNNEASATIENIKEVYQSVMRDNDFL